LAFTVYFVVQIDSVGLNFWHGSFLLLTKPVWAFPI
jgi:hypothetical protein